MLAVQRTGTMKRLVWTAALVDEMLRLRALGLTRREMAQQLGLSYTEVSSALSRALADRRIPSGAPPARAAAPALSVCAQRAQQVAAIVLERPESSRAELMQMLGLDAPKLSQALTLARRLKLVPPSWQPVLAVRAVQPATLRCGATPDSRAAQWLSAIAARALKLAGTGAGQRFALGLEARPRDALTPYAEEAAAMLRESERRAGAAHGCFWVDDPFARRDLHGRDQPFRDLSFSPIGSTAAACLGGC